MKIKKFTFLFLFFAAMVSCTAQNPKTQENMQEKK